MEPPKVTNFNYENSQTLKTESRRSTISIFVSYTNINLRFNCHIVLIASGPLFKACGLVLKKIPYSNLRRTVLSKTRRPGPGYSQGELRIRITVEWFVILSIARAGTLLTKCMREVNLSYKSASRLLNPNMICEFPLLFCMGPIQNVFTP